MIPGYLYLLFLPGMNLNFVNFMTMHNSLWDKCIYLKIEASSGSVISPTPPPPSQWNDLLCRSLFMDSLNQSPGQPPWAPSSCRPPHFEHSGHAPNLLTHITSIQGRPTAPHIMALSSGDLHVNWEYLGFCVSHTHTHTHTKWAYYHLVQCCVSKKLSFTFRQHHTVGELNGIKPNQILFQPIAQLLLNTCVFLSLHYPFVPRYQLIRVQAFFQKTYPVYHVYCNVILGYTCWITLNFGKLKDKNILINMFSSSNCLATETSSKMAPMLCQK